MTAKVTPCSNRYFGLLLLLGCALALYAAPSGWFLAGSNPGGYATGIDSQVVNNGHPSAYLKSNSPSAEGFGTLMQSFSAKNYAGKRLRLSAFAKSDNVKYWAGLWMRVDKGSESVAFDNMQGRPIQGTTGWQNYQVVLDVPSDATGISFGVLLAGQGAVWLNSVNLEVVGSEVTTTDQRNQPLRDEPANLNFENQ